jgi:hypothetical protein
LPLEQPYDVHYITTCYGHHIAPYGAWESPIASKAITVGSAGIGSLKFDDPSIIIISSGSKTAPKKWDVTSSVNMIPMLKEGLTEMQSM